ncbi:hypothetical protein F2Q69_00011052 [Brassica cretica]|uniref:Uncharacterized protein n=1 Tax=Brassica cretica TaxID=69181 RepID=A0A8S9QXR7_BRACR|nr:hypothetical protein F2Q69_00011052 [Brassica cretica]
MTKPKTIQANTIFTTLCGCHLFSIAIAAATAAVSSPPPPLLKSLSSTVDVIVSFAPLSFPATDWQISQILFQ